MRLDKIRAAEGEGGVARDMAKNEMLKAAADAGQLADKIGKELKNVKLVEAGSEFVHRL